MNSLGLVTVLFERSVHFIRISLVLEPVDEGGSSSLNPVTCYSNVMNEQVRQRDIHLLVVVPKFDKASSCSARMHQNAQHDQITEVGPDETFLVWQ